MPTPQYADDLHPKRKGERIRNGEWNALIRGARGDTSLQNGYVDGNYVGSANKPIATAKGVWATCTEEIPPYSVFGVIGDEAGSGSGSGSGSGAFSSPCKINIEKIGVEFAGSHLTLYTNGSIAFKPGKNYATPISMWDTVILTVEGFLPAVGHACGVRPDTYSVEEGRFGFACIGAGPTADTISALRVCEPSKVIGVVVEEISAYTAIGQVFGSGSIKLLVRNNSTQARKTKDPETGETPWIFTVYNARNKVYAVDSLVECTNTLGVGLLVDFGVSGSSSSSSESSSSESESSGSGACPTMVDGVDVSDIPIITPDELAYILVQDNNGCIKRLPWQQCITDSSGSA